MPLVPSPGELWGWQGCPGVHDMWLRLPSAPGWSPTRLPAILSSFLGDQFSGRDQRESRAWQGAASSSLALFHVLCYSCSSAREWSLSCPFQGSGGACQGLPARAEDVPRSPCSFLFPWLSTVSFSNSFLFFLHFAAPIKDFPARRWQGKLILLLLFA